MGDAETAGGADVVGDDDFVVRGFEPADGVITRAAAAVTGLAAGHKAAYR